MKKFKYPLIASAISLVFLPFSVNAVSIKNVDSETSYKVYIEDGGQKFEVTIPPYGIYRTPGPFVTITVKSQKPLRSDGARAEYMIKNGSLSLQKSDNSRRGR